MVLPRDLGLCTAAYGSVAECQALKTEVLLTLRDPAMVQEALETPGHFEYQTLLYGLYMRTIYLLIPILNSNWVCCGLKFKKCRKCLR